MAIDPCTEYGLALALEDFVPVVLAGAGAIVLATAAGRRVPELRDPGAGRRPPHHRRRSRQGDLEDARRERAVPQRRAARAAALPVPGLRLRGAGLGRRRRPPRVGGRLGAVRRGRRCSAPSPPWRWARSGRCSSSPPSARSRWPWSPPAGRWDQGDRRTTVLFALYVVGTLVLPPLAARPEQSQTLQWVEQLTNTAVQLCFLLGALALRGRATPSTTLRPTPKAQEHRA